MDQTPIYMKKTKQNKTQNFETMKKSLCHWDTEGVFKTQRGIQYSKKIEQL